MKMKHLTVLILALSLLAFGLPKNIKKKIDKEIQIAYEVETFSFEAKNFATEITKDLPSKFDEDSFFEIKSKEQLLGYAYLAKAASKTADFDYLVLLDKDLVIKKAKVLVYREEYGGEIGSKRWLKQFIGKTQNDDLRYGDNIVAISGATISVRSMTSAMNSLLASLKVLQEKKML